MSKLYKLKQWLTLSETSKSLSIAFGEDVTEVDILRLGIDGQLRLSIRFINDVPAICGTVGKQKYSEEAAALARAMSKREGKPFDEKVLYSTSVPLTTTHVDENTKYFNETGMTWLREIWDLPMIGDEKREVENRYQKLTNGPESIHVCHEYGAFVEGADGDMYRLIDQFDEHSPPLFGLPESSVIVVRTDELQNFVKSVSKKPVIRDESLVGVLAALLSMFPAGKAPTGKELEQAANSIQVKISDCTIRKALKAASDLAPTLIK